MMERAIFLKGKSGEKNILAKFTLPLTGAEETTLRMAAGTAFRVEVNGNFVFYGPLRAEHGVSLIHTFDLTPYLTAGENTLSVFVAAYNVYSYYQPKDTAFFTAEVMRGGKTYTQDDFTGYHLPQREQKVQRYSYQRTLSEVYDLRRKAIPCETESVPFPTLRTHNLTYPYMGVIPFTGVETGIAEQRDDLFQYQIPGYARVSGGDMGFADSEITVNLYDEVNRMYFCPKGEGRADYRYTLYDLGANKTGFIEYTLTAESDVTVYALFDEILLEEEKGDPVKANTVHPNLLRLAPMRSDTVNCVKVTFPKGKYHFSSFEPYTMRYLKLVVTGEGKIESASMRLYENAEVTATFQTDNEKLNAVWKAAVGTFAQNAVDVLTDCPSRERAGWLCDSSFTAESERLFTGKNTVENHFLTVILNHGCGQLPSGVFPMCYPADHPTGQFIPNWDMWLIVELKNYLARTRDSALIQAYAPKIHKLLDFFATYENEDGLLEKLPSWVFVEWSRANEFVQDVNYPSNMFYAYVLEIASELYGNFAWKEKAEKVRKTVLSQAFDGTYFRDHAIRENGKLVLQKETTETCQYYALYTGLVDKNSHPKFYQNVMQTFGPFRNAEVTEPEVYKSNAFVGNYMRLELWLREENYEKVLLESVEFFYKMAVRTGTLWEHDNPGASCCHGFASKAAVYLAQACLGYHGTDANGNPVLGDKFVSQNAVATFPVNGKTLRIEIKNGKRTVTY